MLIFEEMNENNLSQVADLEKRCFGKYAWSQPLLSGELSDGKKHYYVIKEED